MTHKELTDQLDKTWHWLIETFTAMSDEERTAPTTASESDNNVMWSAQDHFIHLFGIETRFNSLIQRFVDGNANPLSSMMHDDAGGPRDVTQIMANVHAMNDRWLELHRDKPFAELVTVAKGVRAKTLALITQLSDAQLATQIPLAPWGGGTIAGILAANSGHATMHMNWLKGASKG